MPAEYKIDKSKKMVFTKAYGILTDQEAYTHQDKLRNDPDFDPGYSQLIDSTNVKNLRIYLWKLFTSWQNEILLELVH